MAYFPVFIEIAHKKCLLIGGGKVALRKAETLLRYGARVQVMSREVCEELRALLPPEDILERELILPPTDTCGEDSTQRLEEFVLWKNVAADFADAALVIAATGSREVNHRVASLCRERRIPVNVADAPEECTFFFPAVVKKGDISIGINTGGKSPVMSGRVRREIEESVPDYYAEATKQLGWLREYVKGHVDKEPMRRKILKQTAETIFLYERILSQDEINTIIRQVLNHGTISGGPAGH